MDVPTGWCEGCGRTRAEIQAWRKLTPFRRQAVERDLGRRMRQLAAAQDACDGTGSQDHAPSGATDLGSGRSRDRKPT